MGSATECDVTAFLEGCGVRGTLASERPVVLLSVRGRPSGLAEVHFVSVAAAEAAYHAVHMQRMGNRYIEVLTSFDDARGAGCTFSTARGGVGLKWRRKHYKVGSMMHEN